jgi:hypothetical protein
MRQHILIEEYGKRIVKGLQEAGMSAKDIEATMDQLDVLIYDGVMEDLYENLDESRQEEFDALIGKNPPAEEILAFLGSDADDFKVRYLYKLEDYLANLDKNFPDLKAKVASYQSI